MSTKARIQAPVPEPKPRKVPKRRRRTQPEDYIWLSEAKDKAALLAEQGGKCAGCGLPQNESKRAFHLDHCHATNIVRGVFCSGCNVAMGQVHDDAEVLRRLADIVDKGWEDYLIMCQVRHDAR